MVVLRLETDAPKYLPADSRKTVASPSTLTRSDLRRPLPSSCRLALCRGASQVLRRQPAVAFDLSGGLQRTNRRNVFRCRRMIESCNVVAEWPSLKTGKIESESERGDKSSTAMPASAAAIAPSGRQGTEALWFRVPVQPLVDDSCSQREGDRHPCEFRESPPYSPCLSTPWSRAQDY